MGVSFGAHPGQTAVRGQEVSRPEVQPASPEFVEKAGQRGQGQKRYGGKLK